MIDMSITIDATPALTVLHAITDDALYEKMANAVADEDVLPALMKYPSPSGAPMRFKSAKQRAYVIAAIRSGAIQVPYQRTGRTGSSYAKQSIAGGVAVVSNLASAEYTRGPGQAEYHRGNWTTHEELAIELEADAALTALGVIVDAIGDAAP